MTALCAMAEAAGRQLSKSLVSVVVRFREKLMACSGVEHSAGVSLTVL